MSAPEYEKARLAFIKNMQGNNYAKGNKLSDDTKQKMSNSHKNKGCGEHNSRYGTHCSDKTKEIISNKLKGKNNPSARQIRCIETGEIFDTIKQATEWCKIGHSDIAAYIRGKQKSAGKHPITGEKLHWEYVE